MNFHGIHKMCLKLHNYKIKTIYRVRGGFDRLARDVHSGIRVCTTHDVVLLVGVLILITDCYLHLTQGFKLSFNFYF